MTFKKFKLLIYLVIPMIFFQNCTSQFKVGDSATMSSTGNSNGNNTQTPPNDPPPYGKFPIGMNLGTVCDYCPQWTFVDLFKGSRPWITQNASGGGSWDTGFLNKMPKDANGYPTVVPFQVSGQPDQVALNIAGNSTLPTGKYTFLADGDGDIDFTGGGISYVKRSQPYAGSDLSYDVTFNSGHDYVIMKITRSNSSNHLRNFRFIMPGFLSTYQTQPFHPMFLDRLKGFNVLRYMDFLETNGNTVSTASERTTPGYYTQHDGRGAAMEYVAQLANASSTDVWINIPHKADDSLIQAYAQILFQNLRPELRVYVEYSNELWNNMFAQTQYMYSEGCKDSRTFVPYSGGNDWGIPGCDDGLSSFRYQAMRSARIFDIFDSVFGNQAKTRLVKVLGGQAANSWSSDQILGYYKDTGLNPNKQMPTSLAVAPYFGGDVANTIHNQGKSASITVSEIITMAGDAMNKDSFAWMASCKNIANKYGINMIAYEGGQHLVGTGGVENDDVLNAKLWAANRDPGMQTLYENYLLHWYNVTKADMFVLFNNVDSYSKWGSWGMLERQDQDLNTAPKYQAIKKFFGP